MNMYTTQQLLDAADECEAQGVSCAAPMLREYAAHLAAQAEWPSEEDVARDVGGRLFNGLLSTQLSEREVRDAVVAALQSVRPPVGVVSDEDVARACDAASHSDSFVGGGYSKQAIRAALKSYASRHAPTKD